MILSALFRAASLCLIPLALVCARTLRKNEGSVNLSDTYHPLCDELLASIIMIIMIKAVISVAVYLVDKGGHTARLFARYTM